MKLAKTKVVSELEKITATKDLEIQDLKAWLDDGESVTLCELAICAAMRKYRSGSKTALPHPR